MIILLSPAKTLDFTPTERELEATKPVLHTEAKKLAAEVQGLSAKELGKLMSISEKLSTATHEYFADWKTNWNVKGAKQAALAFKGDVYQGLNAETLTDKQLEKAQQQLRLLSGLYGVLKPLDLIQAYRLEMGTKLKNERGADLYAWWGDRVTKKLKADLVEGNDNTIVNLASNEYWSVVDPSKLDAEVITPVFKDFKNGKYKMISFFAKRARGMMARHLIRSRAVGVNAIQSFNASGYFYSEEESTQNSPVFLRDEIS